METDNQLSFKPIIAKAIAAMVREAGWNAEYKLTKLHGGANNQVFRVDAGPHRTVLKIYFQHPSDRRDRMGVEFAFGTVLWNGGIKTIPRPLLKNETQKLALYSFVPGRWISGDEVSDALVDQAATFFQQINEQKTDSDAIALPLASEAYFSVPQHLAGVGHRVDALRHIKVNSEADRQVQQFLTDHVMPAWEQVRENLTGFDSDVKVGDRCLSPSDFGFHNALIDAAGVVTFLDFEYAGWDDPARTICDFFCQPKIPVPTKYFDRFANALAACSENPASVIARAKRLFPLYQVKWCCILLNEFLPVDQKRRHFSDAKMDREQHKIEQLKKAQAALQKIGSGGVSL
jgi:hypothetical protein